MKRRKLKGYVLPTLYLLIVISIFTGVIFLGQNASLQESDYDYGVSAIEDNVESVVGEDTIVANDIVSPVDTTIAELSVHYYDKDASAEEQQQSLIFYENTYLPNTGVLYTSDNEFEVSVAFAGKVSEILDDEFFGKCVVVEHNDKLRTYYYGLQDIEVAVGDELANNTVIGTAKTNTIMNTKKSFLFEVYYNNELMNPEKFIGTKITDYK